MPTRVMSEAQLASYLIQSLVEAFRIAESLFFIYSPNMQLCPLFLYNIYTFFFHRTTT